MRNLDVLRAIAVMLVLFAHTTKATRLGPTALTDRIDVNLGRFGVLLFFVHTALVLMMSMQRSADRPLWPLRFYIQRIFRIYPLSILCVVAVLLLHIPFMPFRAFALPSAANILQNLTLTQNLTQPHPIRVGNLIVANNSVSHPMWSLPFEIQMYLLLPLAFVFLRRWGKSGAYLLVAASS